MSAKKILLQDVPCLFQCDNFDARPGKLRLTQIPDEIYLFEWFPEIYRQFDIRQYNIEESKIYFFLHHIGSIQISGTDQQAIIRFLAPKLPSLCHFIFGDVSEILHWIEELKMKDLLVNNVKFPGIWTVKAKCEKSFTFSNDYISLAQATCFQDHRVIIKKWEPIKQDLEEFGMEDLARYRNEDGTFHDFEDLKKEVFERGLSPESRPHIWPLLFKFFTPEMNTEEQKAHVEKRYQEYAVVSKQVDCEIEAQAKFNKIFSVVRNDVARSDKKQRFFEKNDSIARKMLIRILLVLDRMNRDTGYVQGMGDLVTPLFAVFVKDIQENECTMFDDTKMDVQRCESFIFWNYMGLMSVSGQESLFKNLAENQLFIAQKSFEIAEILDPRMTRWLEAKNLKELMFLHSTFLLQFRRSYETSDVVKIWDRIYSAEKPWAFVRFVVASVLFFLFPAIAASPATELGDIIGVVEREIGKTDVLHVIGLAKKVLIAAQEKQPMCEWYFMELPSAHYITSNYPKYFELKKW